ncbi:protein rep [Actinomycetospora rhizophila]|uniref:Protein rep n=1 Tax=Actinomycetospora rhizophila TaxID=1416876 RepID=A0ABV9ZGM0_9PSEU
MGDRPCSPSWEPRPAGGAFPVGDHDLADRASSAPEEARGRDGAETRVIARARAAGGGAARPPGAGLGNTWASLPAEPGHPGGEADEAQLADERRRARHGLRRGLRKVTSLDSLRRCGKVTRTGTGAPILRTGGGHAAGFTGLVSCGSVWACPCCAAKVAAERASDLATVLEKVHAEGGSSWMVTLTLRHNASQPLAELWSAVAKAWERVTSGRGWTVDSVGLRGWAKVTEVTHSPRNGWHTHLHAVLCFGQDLDEDVAQRIAMRMWRRWDAQLRRDGLDSTPVHGVQAERVRPGHNGLAEYFVKAAREVTSPITKESRAGRSPFAIGRDAAETGDARDIALWREFEQASHRRRQLTWSTKSRDLRAWAGLRRERTDEEIAQDEGAGEDQIALTRETWSEIGDTTASDELRWVADRDGIVAAGRWLDARGLTWSSPAAAPRRGRVCDRPRPVSGARAVLVAPRRGGVSGRA